MKLIIASGPNRGRMFNLPDGQCTIGRSHTNHLALYDRRVSARHAVIAPTPDGPVIHDLGSSNGTYANGKLVSRAVLNSGDTIQLGDTVIAVDTLPVADKPARPFRVVQRPGDASSSIRATAPSRDSSAVFETSPSVDDIEALREDRRKLLALYRINHAINTVSDTQGLIIRVLEEIVEVLDPERGFVMLLDPGSDALIPAAMRLRHRPQASELVTMSRAITDHVLRKGEAVLSTDTALDARFAGSDSVVAEGPRSAMCAPLHGCERIQGIIYIDSPATSHAFGPEDLPVLIAMANQLGIAIENTSLAKARLVDEHFAAIGQAVTGLSHYIKNILSSMQGGAQIVQRSLDRHDAEALRTGWDIVRRNERRISELVLDMLNYSGASDMLFEPCDLNNLIDEAAEAIPAQTSKTVSVDVDLAPDLPMVVVDSNAIYRCLLNFVSNAIDALPDDGGSVRFATRYDKEERAARLAVADSGCGIDPELLPAIFDVFVSTKGSRGTGLGLAVVQKLAAAHGGRVEVDSQPGKGTTFTLVLPLRPPQARLRTVPLPDGPTEPRPPQDE